MTGAVLILRPEPGASATAARAEAYGLRPFVAPLFTIRRLDWEAPDPSGVDSVLLTSANAARHGGDNLRSLAALPCYAVGEATAGAARRAGFRDVRTGPADGAAALAMMAAGGVREALHLCARDHIPLAHPGLKIERRFAYAADPAARLPAEAAEAIEAGALVLVHSPRAGALFAALAPERRRIALAAISGAAADAAGPGWRSKDVAAAVRDDALLELAAKLCQTAAPDGSGADGW